jgi:Family of unknown function (DUF6533)
MFTSWQAYEYFLTLDREVCAPGDYFIEHANLLSKVYYVWGSRWSFGKIIFIWNRYSPIVDTVLAVYSQ